MVDVENRKQWTEQEWQKIKQTLKDSRCFSDSEKCSINCEWLALCDKCYDDDKITPFCRQQFRDIVYGKPIRKDVDGDDVCSLEYHMTADYGEEEEKDNRQTCPKCGFKTDSQWIFEHHSCRGEQKS